MHGFWNWFVKITGWLPQLLVFRTHVYYEDKTVQGKRIKGPALVISNHTSVWDFAVLLFVFFSRTVRWQIAELQFEKKFLGKFLRMLGGIKVDRVNRNFAFIAESEDILRKGGAVGVFPESRLPLKTEERPLPFKPSAAYIALSTNVPVIPVYTNGSYFTKKHASVIIGKPINVCDLTDDGLDEKTNIDNVTEALRERVIELGKLLEANGKD